MGRPRPRVPGKPNPAKIGYQQQTSPQEANSRQMVPVQLSKLQYRANAAKGMAGGGKTGLMYRKG
jgi:hypothetical protein